MNKWVELLLGLILVIVPILVAWYSQMWGAWDFWSAAGIFFKGGVFWAIIMIGLLFILLGISDLKESKPAPKRSHSQTPQHQVQMQTMPVIDMTSQSSSSTQTPKRSKKK